MKRKETENKVCILVITEQNIHDKMFCIDIGLQSSNEDLSKSGC